MKKILITILLIILFNSCSNEKPIDLNVDRFYYRDNKFEIYQFKKDSLLIFDIYNLDSVENAIKFYKHYFKAGKKKFTYKKLDSDLLVSNYKDTSDFFKLKKFNLKMLSDSELVGTEWKFIDLDSSFSIASFFIRIEEKEIINFLKYQDSSSIIFGASPNLGKRFDSFRLYNDQASILLPINIKNDTLYMLAGNNSITKLNKFKKVITDTLDSKLLGKWKLIQFKSLDSKFNSPLMTFIKETEQTKKGLFLWELNISNQGFMVQNIRNRNGLIIKKYKVSYNKETKYLYLSEVSEDKKMPKNNYDVYKLIELTKDLLIMKNEEETEIYHFKKVK